MKRKAPAPQPATMSSSAAVALSLPPTPARTAPVSRQVAPSGIGSGAATATARTSSAGRGRSKKSNKQPIFKVPMFYIFSRMLSDRKAASSEEGSCGGVVVAQQWSSSLLLPSSPSFDDDDDDDDESGASVGEVSTTSTATADDASSFVDGQRDEHEQRAEKCPPSRRRRRRLGRKATARRGRARARSLSSTTTTRSGISGSSPSNPSSEKPAKPRGMRRGRRRQKQPALQARHRPSQKHQLPSKGGGEIVRSEAASGESGGLTRSNDKSAATVGGRAAGNLEEEDISSTVGCDVEEEDEELLVSWYWERQTSSPATAKKDEKNLRCDINNRKAADERDERESALDALEAAALKEDECQNIEEVDAMEVVSFVSLKLYEGRRRREDDDGDARSGEESATDDDVERDGLGRRIDYESETDETGEVASGEEMSAYGQRSRPLPGQHGLHRRAQQQHIGEDYEGEDDPVNEDDVEPMEVVSFVSLQLYEGRAGSGAAAEAESAAEIADRSKCCGFLVCDHGTGALLETSEGSSSFCSGSGNQQRETATTSLGPAETWQQPQHDDGNDAGDDVEPMEFVSFVSLQLHSNKTSHGSVCCVCSEEASTTTSTEDNNLEDGIQHDGDDGLVAAISTDKKCRTRVDENIAKSSPSPSRQYNGQASQLSDSASLAIETPSTSVPTVIANHREPMMVVPFVSLSEMCKGDEDQPVETEEDPAAAPHHMSLAISSPPPMSQPAAAQHNRYRNCPRFAVPSEISFPSPSADVVNSASTDTNVPPLLVLPEVVASEAVLVSSASGSPPPLSIPASDTTPAATNGDARSSVTTDPALQSCIGCSSSTPLGPVTSLSTLPQKEQVHNLAGKVSLSLYSTSICFLWDPVDPMIHDCDDSADISDFVPHHLTRVCEQLHQLLKSHLHAPKDEHTRTQILRLVSEYPETCLFRFSPPTSITGQKRAAHLGTATNESHRAEEDAAGTGTALRKGKNESENIPCYPLHYCCVTGWLEGIRATYNAIPECIGHENAFGWPLHYALQHCRSNVEGIMFLVNKYQEAIRRTNSLYQTPLHLACSTATVCNQWPLSSDSFIAPVSCSNASTGSSSSGSDSQRAAQFVPLKSPFSSLLDQVQSSFNNRLNLSVVRLLLSHYPTAAQLADRSGWTPVHLICQMCPKDEEKYSDMDPGISTTSSTEMVSEATARLDILSSLLEASPTAVRATTRRLEKPLHIAAQHYYGAQVTSESYSVPCQLIHLLLSKDSSAAASTDTHFQTPLHWLAMHRLSSTNNASDVETVKALLKACPDAKSWRNSSDLRPYDLAVRAGTTCDEILSLLEVGDEDTTPNGLPSSTAIGCINRKPTHMKW